jgi:hypothetical protein
MWGAKTAGASLKAPADRPILQNDPWIVSSDAAFGVDGYRSRR